MTTQAATPMLRQYQKIKAKHQDCILFYRLGDFYEMFYDDAIVASKILDLVLTSRGKGTANHVPMCGIPFHAAENYIAKLIKAGLKVAICEQVEDPSNAKGLVERDVIRVITSGTFLDEHSTSSRYLICLNPQSKTFGLSFIDPSTGTIQTNQYPNQQILSEIIARLPVYECIFPESSEETVKTMFKKSMLQLKPITLSPYEDWCFNPEIAQKALCEHFGVHSLKGYGLEEMPTAISSAGALLEYLKQMNKQPLKHIDKICLYSDNEYAYISPAAIYGLELGSLFKTINHTFCALGKRKLHYWLYHPLKKPSAILKRQAAITLLRNETNIQQRLKEHLTRFPDVEKNISKLSCGYTHAKDILSIRNALCILPDIKDTTKTLAEKNTLFAISDIPDLRNLLEKAINPEMPLAKSEGKVIREGFDKDLDELKDIQENGRQWLKSFQERESKRSGISSLKVGFNRVFGYYIEITKSNLKSAPQDYIRKQTLVNAERFITPELKEYEEKILSAQDKIIKIESRIIAQLQKEILFQSIQLHEYGESIAVLDALTSLTRLSLMPNYTAPSIDENTVIDIKAGRHPVVEEMLNENFIANDTYLDCGKNHLIILTGPNMAGKSTYIRQIAILIILAQMGSYIPAQKAAIGVADKIFTRIGAHDDITKGQSTFMVEMSETADILNNLTDRSLVILDEIGRGTSTYDGLSLAWALAEHLKDKKARTLFATHFHELTALADEHDGIKNFNVAVKEWKDEVIFLHKIIPGSTDDSYGIYVAKLAGMPKNVIGRAKKILRELELKGNLKERLSGQPGKEKQLSLFTGKADPLLEEIKEIIKALNINNIRPIDALNTLEELKNKIEE